MVNVKLGAVVDKLLAHGYFRMRQCMFTCSSIGEDDPVTWLRVDLTCLEEDKVYRKLQKLNRHFRLAIGPATLSDEQEGLYQLYKASKPYALAPSLKDILLDEYGSNAFDSWMISIYDDEALIGCGFFDKGLRDAAGIKSFYHPGYSKFSIGKYLIYQKMAYCKQNKMRYYYPGYVSKNNRAFDYKLSLGVSSIEYFDALSQQWKAYWPDSKLFDHHNYLGEWFDAVSMKELVNAIALRVQEEPV